MYSLFLHFLSFTPLFYLVLGPDNDNDDKNGDEKGDDNNNRVNPRRRSKEKSRKLTEKRRRRQRRCTPKIGERSSSLKVLVYSKDTLLWMGGLYVVVFFYSLLV